MKKITEIKLRFILIQVGVAFIIAHFNRFYGAFFLFGGALVSFLYEYFKLIKKTPKN